MYKSHFRDSHREFIDCLFMLPLNHPRVRHILEHPAWISAVKESKHAMQPLIAEAVMKVCLLGWEETLNYRNDKTVITFGLFKSPDKVEFVCFCFSATYCTDFAHPDSLNRWCRSGASYSAYQTLESAIQDILCYFEDSNKEIVGRIPKLVYADPRYERKIIGKMIELELLNERPKRHVRSW